MSIRTKRTPKNNKVRKAKNSKTTSKATKATARLKSKKQKQRSKVTPRKLIVGGTMIDLEWGFLPKAVAQKIIEQGIKGEDIYQFFDNSESGLLSDMEITVDGQIVEVDHNKLLGDKKATKQRLRERNKWLLLKTEFQEGDVFELELFEDFDVSKLRIFREIYVNGSDEYTLITPTYDNRDFEIGSTISGTDFGLELIDPSGKTHDFETLED